MYAQMAELGLRQTVIGVRFVPSEPLVIQDKLLLDEVIPNAVEAGIDVVLAVYPYPPREIEAGIGSPSLFGSYVGALASIYPQVRTFVIGNEPNQPAFWRPQFDAAGRNVSAAAFGPYLAAAYDALDSVDPDLSVVGVGTLAARQRPAAREEQHLHVSRALPARARRVVPEERPHAPAHGRVQLPPVPERGDRPARARLRLAERRLRGPRPDEAGALGRVPRDPAVDDRRRPEAAPRRGRLAGRHVGSRRLPRCRERPRHRRAHAVPDLRPARPARSVRPGRRRSQLLRVPRRRPAHGVPGRALPGRRQPATLRRGGADRDRRDRFGLLRPGRELAPGRAGRRGEGRRRRPDDAGPRPRRCRGGRARVGLRAGSSPRERRAARSA